MGLSNYQLVLLDNLIYLDSCIVDKGTTIGDLVDTLLYAPASHTAGTGTIDTDCKNVYKIDDKNCLMSKDEWIDNGIGGYSKGGNMAQYVALFCDEAPIDRFFLK